MSRRDFEVQAPFIRAVGIAVGFLATILLLALFW